MSQSEVFRPSNGPLVVRSTIANGVNDILDSVRPATQSGYRFGQLSRNSFFTRHNPHPNRVRHMKGLLDVPICSVNDQGFFANPRYSLQFPPDSFNQKKLGHHRIPVNAINVNSQLHPINTITGLQYFTGLRNYPWRERAIPQMGLVPVTEAWRDELRQLAEAAGLSSANQEPAKQEMYARPKTMYSSETGRLIPPPSRALTRGGTRWGHRFPAFQHISTEPDMENTVLTMLCQILQTDDINAVQAWLCSAGDREKGVVLDLIKSATTNREEYYKQYPAQFVQPLQIDEKTALPPIGATNGITDNGFNTENSDGKFDRLTIEDSVMKPTLAVEKTEDVMKLNTEEDQVGMMKLQPPVTDVFQTRETSKVQLLIPPKKHQEPTEACLRYTMSPVENTRPDNADMDTDEWNQLSSTTPYMNTF